MAGENGGTSRKILSDPIREQLRALREAMAEDDRRLDERRERRDQLVEEAREAGMTWAEISSLTGLTTHGLLKAQRRREIEPRQNARAS